MRHDLEQAGHDHRAALQRREAELQSQLRELQEALSVQRQLIESGGSQRARR